MKDGKSKRPALLISTGGCLLLVALLCSLVVLFPYPMFFSSPPPKEEKNPSWSPDSQRLIYECYRDGKVDWEWLASFDPNLPSSARQSFYAEEASDLCIIDLDERQETRLKQPGGDWYPVWSPDGSHIAYLRQDGIYLVTPEGGEPRQLVATEKRIDAGWEQSQETLAWSPDGQQLLFSGCLDNTDRDVYVVDVNTGTLRNLTPDSRLQDYLPSWILDGTHIVFVSNDEPISVGLDCLVYSGGGNHYLLKLMQADGSAVRTISEQSQAYRYVRATNDGRVSYAIRRNVGYYDSGVMDAVRGSLLYQFSTDKLYWSADGTMLAGIMEGLSVLDLETGKALNWLSGERPYNLVWSSDGRRIAAGVKLSNDFGPFEKHVYVYNVEDGSVTHICTGAASSLCEEHLNAPALEPVYYLDVTHMACPGEMVELKLQTSPGMRCELSAYIPAEDGESTNLELPSQETNGEGICTWQWQLPPDALPGTVVHYWVKVEGSARPSFDLGVVACQQ